MPSQTLPPFKPLDQKPPSVEVDYRPDGTILLASAYPLADQPDSIAHLLDYQSGRFPNRKFLGQRPFTDPQGDWQYIHYGQAKQHTDAIASALLARGFDQSTSIMILSGNSIEHALLMLGAMKAKVPVAPVSVAYSLLSSSFSKLKHAFALVRPKMILVDYGAFYVNALKALDLTDCEVVYGQAPPDGVEAKALTSFQSLLDHPVDADAIATSMAKIDHDTIAKYLFTSGSTGMPKGVVQTQGMMCALIGAQFALETHPTDQGRDDLGWLPWSHIAAGNVGFNWVIADAATFHIDYGKPLPGMFEATVKNLREISPEVFGNVPIAWSWLADALEKDQQLCASFFKKLKFMGYGGATLSQDIYERMQKLAIKTTGFRVPFTTMYGATETQAITMVHWASERVGLIGAPLPGITIKLVPYGEKYEVRVKGPTVTPGYLGDSALTDAAFDEEGFYKLGDAAKFVDPKDPNQGLEFDGRITEDFKLASGTWVSTGTLRAKAVAAASPYLLDAVICGHDQHYVALLAWPNIAACHTITEGLTDPQAIIEHPALKKAITDKLKKYNHKEIGSSNKIKRVLLLAELPSIDTGEMTDKGYINQRAVLDLRVDAVKKLYQDSADPALIMLDH